MGPRDGWKATRRRGGGPVWVVQIGMDYAKLTGRRGKAIELVEWQRDH